MSDSDLLDLAGACNRTARPLTDGLARVVAASWHGGQASHLYALASSGAIDLAGVEWELQAEIAEVTAAADSHTQDTDPLNALLTYCRTHGDRGPVQGWSEVWG